MYKLVNSRELFSNYGIVDANMYVHTQHEELEDIQEEYFEGNSVAEIASIIKNLVDLNSLYEDNKYNSNLDLEYPAYFNKGKNSANIFNIVLTPKNQSNADYSRGSGLYFTISKYSDSFCVEMYFNGVELYSNYMLTSVEPDTVRLKILEILSDDEKKFLKNFINILGI